VKDEYIKVVVVSAQDGILTLNVVFYNEVDRIPLILSYAVDTRKSLNSPDKSAWLWVNGADFVENTIKIGKDPTSVVEATEGYWVLAHSDGDGNASRYYYDRTTGVLVRAEGRFLGPDFEGTVLVTLETSRVGRETVEWPTPSSTQSTTLVRGNPDDGPRGDSHVTTWSPPWLYASGTTELYGYGYNAKHASTAEDVSTGKEYTDARAAAGPGFGGARAQAWVTMRFPSAYSFSVPISGAYTITTHHTLNGEAYGQFGCAGPFGCASSDGWIWIRNEVYEVSTGISIGYVEKTIWDAPWIPDSGWAYWWNNVHCDIERTYYLDAGTSYYGIDRVHSKQIAAAVGFVYGYSEVHFESKFYMAVLIAVS
jgi:hypothetical protein